MANIFVTRAFILSLLFTVAEANIEFHVESLWFITTILISVCFLIYNLFCIIGCCSFLLYRRDKKRDTTKIFYVNTNVKRDKIQSKKMTLSEENKYYTIETPVRNSFTVKRSKSLQELRSENISFDGVKIDRFVESDKQLESNQHEVYDYVRRDPGPFSLDKSTCSSEYESVAS